MHKLIVFAILLAVCLCSVALAAPASQLLDADTIIKRIIAEYERLPGPSRHYPPQVATLIDPTNFRLNF